jgi:pyruvate ferredoxin oxidoreductase beta subunit
VKNILCVCANASGKQQFAKQLGIAGYAATASLSDTDDLLAKLQKASAMQGLRFIEILAPCPNIWLSDTSNTVEICRQAVEIGAWPLYELDRGKFSLSYKPQKLEKIDTFVTLQKKLSPNAEYLEKSWRLMMLGKPFESEI